MGGEWASGAALVSETWPARHRGKALGLMQSCWAIGYGLAAAVVMLILPRYGWRAVFLVGILPALFTWWIRRSVPEPELWRTRHASQGAASAMQSATGWSAMRGLWFITAALTLMNAATMFAWWGLNLWIPSYLSLSTEQGGIGLDAVRAGWFIIMMQVGMWFGYVTFGFISDTAGRKRTYVVYLLAAAAFVFAYATIPDANLLFWLGPFVAFFGTGYFSGFGAITAEIYPTSIRATAQGFTYNIGRLASASAPFVVGSMAQESGFGSAFTATAAAYLAAAAFWLFIPETRGRVLA
jgi:MFS family permease